MDKELKFWMGATFIAVPFLTMFVTWLQHGLSLSNINIPLTVVGLAVVVTGLLLILK